MQNEQTLIELGFKENSNGEWIKKGQYQTFVAIVEKYNGPTYISLLLMSNKTDQRLNSNSKGHNFKARIKDCCSLGSVERAVKKFDLPWNNLTVVIGGIEINDRRTN